MKCLLTIALTVLYVLPFTDSTGQAAKNLHPLGWGAYSPDFTNVFCGFHNQAALAGLTHFSAGFLVQQRFSIKELRQYQFAVAVPTSSGNFGLVGDLSGYEGFRRQELGLVYARQLFEWLDIGAQMDYLNMRVPGIGSTHAFTFALAALFHINEQWHAGIQAFNPVQVAYQKLGKDRIPDVYQLGIGYRPSKVFLLTTEIRRIENRNIVAVAFQYQIAKTLTLTAGSSAKVYPVFAGISLHLNPIEIILTASYHQQLGLTPGAGVIFNPIADEF